MNGSMMMVLMISTLMGISSSHWVVTWVMMEINTISMCYLMSKESGKYKMMNHPTMKYYLVQVISSMMIITVAINSMTMMKEVIFLLAIMMKMGGWPSHLWYVYTLKNMKMSMYSFWVVMTWQKILPLVLLSSMGLSLPQNSMLLMLVVMSILAPLSMLNKTTSNETILAVSSLNSNGWMILTSMVSEKVFFLFLMTYTLTLWSVLKTLKENTKKQQQVSHTAWNNSIVMMNLGGIPPLGMFWMKTMIFKKSMEACIPLELLMVLVFMACYMVYYYMWMNLTNLTKSPEKQQLTKLNSNKTTETILLVLSTLPPMVMLMSLG